MYYPLNMYLLVCHNDYLYNPFGQMHEQMIEFVSIDTSNSHAVDEQLLIDI